MIFVLNGAPYRTRGDRSKSLTSVAISGAGVAIMWSKRVLWLVMFRVENWALTCANQTSGSAGQNGGILMATTETEVGGECG